MNPDRFVERLPDGALRNALMQVLTWAERYIEPGGVEWRPGWRDPAAHAEHQQLRDEWDRTIPRILEIAASRPLHGSDAWDEMRKCVLYAAELLTGLLRWSDNPLADRTFEVRILQVKGSLLRAWKERLKSGGVLALLALLIWPPGETAPAAPEPQPQAVSVTEAAAQAELDLLRPKIAAKQGELDAANTELDELEAQNALLESQRDFARRQWAEVLSENDRLMAEIDSAPVQPAEPAVAAEPAKPEEEW